MIAKAGALSLRSSSSVASRRFRDFQRLTVRQRKKWIEILLTFELTNKYDVFDETQHAVLHVEEVGGGFLGFLARVFLGPFRPFRAEVSDLDSSEVLLLLRRPFRFIFHRLEVQSGSGDPIGAIEKRWSWLRRIYQVEDANRHGVAELFGPILKPWTFEIRRQGAVLGSICKRWSGFGKELFTDADNFGVDLSAISEPDLKLLSFAATVLIDVVHFERSKG